MISVTLVSARSLNSSERKSGMIFSGSLFTPGGLTKKIKDLITLAKHTTGTLPKTPKSASSSSSSPQLTLVESDSDVDKESKYVLRLIDDGLTYPELCLKVHVAGPPEDVKYFPQWLGRAACTGVEDPLEADLVIFSGGSDVNPELYNHRRLPNTYIDPARDEADIALYKLCVDNGIPMLGICRGAQFLWVMQGGTLYQDLDNHNDGEHEITCYPLKKRYLASSVHHQACFPTGLPGFRLIASADISMTREAATHVSSGKAIEYEIYSFEEKGILGIQGHPEYPGWPEYSKMCLDLINECIVLSKHTSYTQGKMRVKNPA